MHTPAADSGAEAPDIYCAEAAFVLKYAQGNASGYAAPYEDLGIDVAADIEAADITQYTIDIGTNPDGKLTIDPKREEFLDLSKELKDNGYHNDTQD